jgi:hypothetical protein
MVEILGAVVGLVSVCIFLAHAIEAYRAQLHPAPPSLVRGKHRVRQCRIRKEMTSIMTTIGSM